MSVQERIDVANKIEAWDNQVIAVLTPEIDKGAAGDRQIRHLCDQAFAVKNVVRKRLLLSLCFIESSGHPSGQYQERLRCNDRQLRWPNVSWAGYDQESMRADLAQVIFVERPVCVSSSPEAPSRGANQTIDILDSSESSDIGEVDALHRNKSIVGPDGTILLPEVHPIICQVPDSLESDDDIEVIQPECAPHRLTMPSEQCIGSSQDMLQQDAGAKDSKEDCDHVMMEALRQNTVDSRGRGGTASPQASEPGLARKRSSPPAPPEVHAIKKIKLHRRALALPLSLRQQAPPRGTRTTARAIEAAVTAAIASRADLNKRSRLQIPQVQAFDEAALYEFFRLPPPTSSSSRADFFLDEVRLESTDGSQAFSLLEIGLSILGQDIVLRGEASPNEDLASLDPLAPDVVAAREDAGDGICEVAISAQQLRLVPTLLGLWIYSPKGRYLVRSLAMDRPELHKDALVFFKYWLIAQNARIHGQHPDGWPRVMRELNAALDGTEVASDAPPFFVEADVVLDYLSPERTRDRNFARLLHDVLFNPPFLTPRVYHIIAPFVLPNTIRTDPDFDFAVFDAEGLAGKEELNRAAQDVREAEIVEAVASGPSKAARCPSSAYGESRSRRRAIKTYEKAVLGGQPYQAGDTVLIIGCPPAREHDATPWVAKVMYFFTYDDQDNRDVFAHVRWYTPRSESSLGKVAHPRALLDVDTCDSLDASFIVRHLAITFVYGAEIPPATGFYVEYLWDIERHGFSAIKKEDQEIGKAAQVRLRQAHLANCPCCARRLIEFDALTPELDKSNRKTKNKRKAGSWIAAPVWREVESSFMLAGACYQTHGQVSLFDFALVSQTPSITSATWCTCRTTISLKTPMSDNRSCSHN